MMIKPATNSGPQFFSPFFAVACGLVAYVAVGIVYNKVVVAGEEEEDFSAQSYKGEKGTEEKEEKVPLVFVNSFQNVRYWRRIVEVLRGQGYDCHCLTVSGGLSAKVGLVSSYISSTLAAAAKPVVFGHSLGALCAQGYARDVDNKCGGLVLVAPLGLAVEEVRKMREVFYPKPEDGLLRFVFDLMFRNLFTNVWIKRRMEPLLFTTRTTCTSLTEEKGEVVTLEEFFVKTACMRRWDGEFKEAEASLPSFLSAHSAVDKNPASLVIEAGDDEVLSKASYFNTAKMWGAERKIIKGQGHNVGDEGWEDVMVGAILGFLEKLEAGDGKSSGFDSGESSDSFVNLDAPNQDSSDDDDIHIDFGDLEGATEISDDEAKTWGSLVGGWFGR